ncbi:MAG TPA: hypothetical protein VL913_00905 [Candidatus Micrarchaeaceae archaeon]|nr:hypothetical protein [Candidatus Micrarchaeaceae archaeon]
MGVAAGRLFFPLAGIAILLGTLIWGPWVTLGISAAALVAAMRFS